MNKYRLFSHFLVVNTIGLAFTLVVYFNGWFGRLREADSSGISFVILGLFALALLSVTRQAFILSSEMDRLAACGNGDLERLRHTLRTNSAALRALEIRLFSRIGHIRTLSNALVVLGLIGTVVGFIMVAAEVNAETAGDVARAGELIGALLHGMGVAFYTTLVGAVCSLWLSMNFQILHSAIASLLVSMMADIDEPASDASLALPRSA